MSRCEHIGPYTSISLKLRILIVSHLSASQAFNVSVAESICTVLTYIYFGIQWNYSPMLHLVACFNYCFTFHRARLSLRNSTKYRRYCLDRETLQ